MYWFSATVVLFASSCSLIVCLEDEHLVPKHGIKSKHSMTRRELSAADAELILKSLLSKLGHSEDSGLMQKKIGVDKGPYSYGPAMTDKFHTASMEESKLKRLTGEQTMGYDHMKSTVPLEKDGYEMKKDIGVSEKDIMELLMKMKELSASETLDDPYEKKSYLGYPGEKFIPEKVRSSKNPITLEKTEKAYGDIVQEDKFNDKDVSLAESLYHMKIAGDVETYPAIKMAPLYNKKIADEKLHFEEDHSVHTDEAYLKKVDEIGTSLSKEESFHHLKDDDTEGYFSKTSEMDKTAVYSPKISHPGPAIKTAGDIAIDEWKANHKDLFAIEGGIFSDEKVKIEDAHHVKDDIAHDELVKKLKSLGLDKELKMDSVPYLEGGISHEIDEELLKKMKETLGLNKELMESDLFAEGDFAHEINEELKKKLKTSLGLDKELVIGGAHHSGEAVAHGMNDELIKKLKSVGLDKEFKIEDAHHLEEGISHEMNDELIKKLKSLGLDKELAMEGTHHAGETIAHGMEDELIKKLKSVGLDKEFKTEDAHFLEGSIGHEINDELIKKLKSLGLDKELGVEGTYHADGAIAHEINDELIKKLKALGLDKEFKIDAAHPIKGGVSHEMNDELLKKLKESGVDIAHEELFHLSKGYHNEKAIAEGSHAYEKAKEEAHKDFHIDLHEEEGKKHMDGALSFGTKEKVHGHEVLFEKGLGAEKAHGIESKIGAGIDKSLDGVLHDEIFKGKEIHSIDTHGIDKTSHGIDKAIYGSKIPLEAEGKHAIAHGSSFGAGVDKAIKVHEDELLKKEKAYGTDSLFHKEILDKEFLGSADEHHIMTEEDAHILHDSHEKHHIETGAEKERKTLKDLKAKFFELLRRVLHMRKCHLVTMRPGELLGIVNCVSRSKDPRLCEKFSICEKKMPLRVITALEKCQKETIPGEVKRCTRYAPLYPSTEIPLKIFQCVAINVRELIPQEQKEMTAFEECARVVKAESCGRVRWFRGAH